MLPLQNQQKQNQKAIPRINYKPHAKQKLFHDAPHKYVAFFCGVGTGKTAASVIEAFVQATRYHPGKVGIATAPTFPMLRDGWLATWKKFIPEQLFSHNKMTNIIELFNGSQILLKPSSEIERAFAGTNVAWICFDEAEHEFDVNAWLALKKRLREGYKDRPLRIFVTTTIPNPNHWLAKEFGVKADGFNFFGDEHSWTSKDGSHIAIRARTADNPFLPDGFESDLRNDPNATPEYIAKYLDAISVSSEAMVFKEFNVSKHILSPGTAFSKRFQTVYCGVDWGHVTGAMIVIGKTKDKEYIVLHEEVHSQVPYDHTGWWKICRNLHAKYKIDYFVCDGAGASFIAAMKLAFPDFQIISANGALKDIDDGIRRIRARLNAGKFNINNICKVTIREFSNYAYIRNKFSGQLTDVPQDKDNHTIDACRYVLNFATKYD